MRNPSVAVYLSGNTAVHLRWFELAHAVGRLLAAQGVTVVYGGARAGMMGALADGALSAGGRVRGVIPRALVERELAHDGITELEVVDTMHERKQRMFERADAYLALPGGFGTMDELFEVLCWRQLRTHERPIAVLNAEGFYDPLFALVSHLEEHSFLPAGHRESPFLDALSDLAHLERWLEPLRSGSAP